MLDVDPRSDPPADDARLAFGLVVLVLAGELVSRTRDAPSAPPVRLPRHLVDLNEAPPGEIEALPGVGPALASRIVETRSYAPFASADDLSRVPGIGRSTIGRLRAFVRCGGR
jgi:DNA uptake protein ComE-like DNA-binding protein